ncbi:Aldo/keto reductase [Dacryopinax primogenitus]|uniref:Aldo/keto reductase n=1 Tax=Dacryopinax primogenitus (strain DJM 731) TaxID=1858805 RepID=M5GGM7_DACPD|nr:Aldo/keto reductase [Dacryopinax primogenitus]EJU05758.1 Aldo/keto reductase [Dacryopinax primogenitus]
MVHSRVPLLFGTASIGAPGQAAVRVSDLDTAQKMLHVFLLKYNYRELDSARVYGGGTTEQYLSQLELRGATVDTKSYPSAPGDHNPEKLRSTLLESRKALRNLPIRAFYLHAPDRSVPFEKTLEEVDKLYKQGHFEIFGLSNFASWEVSAICEICKANGWVKPGIYQAMYNALQRSIEPELVPCLRTYGIRLVVFNPLAGGLFLGKITSIDQLPNEGRFSGAGAFAKLYRERYVKEGYLNALEKIKIVGEKHSLRLTEVALRWCQHHSMLTESDGVILAASSTEQLEMNCADSEKGIAS